MAARVTSQEAMLIAPEFITARQFATLLRISTRTLFRLRARGCIPDPVQISTNTIRCARQRCTRLSRETEASESSQEDFTLTRPRLTQKRKSGF